MRTVQVVAVVICLLVLLAAGPLLSRAETFYNVVFGPTPNETQAVTTVVPALSCNETENSWCAVVDYYSKHQDAPPVEIVFGHPSTWFNLEPPMHWPSTGATVTSFKRVPFCNVPCRFLSKASETTSFWFEFHVDAESFQPSGNSGKKIGNIRLVMEAWSIDKGMPDSQFAVAATIHLDNVPPRLPFTYPDFPMAVRSVHITSLTWYQDLFKPTKTFGQKSSNGRALIGLFLRHCGVDHRDNFIRNLKAELPIDSFGGCFHSREVSAECKGKPYFEEKVCELRNYRFVLGIENTLINDYVTEKFYHALWAGAIPIYWGGPNAGNFLPPNSTIYIPEFANVSELVERVKEVGSNETLWNAHQEWRKKPLPSFLDYVFKYSRAEGTCNICKRAAVFLHDKIRRENITLT